MKSRLLLFFGLLTSHMEAAEIRVAPGEKAITAAMEAAAAGDVIVLAPGVHREAVRIEKALTLRGEAGAILDGATALGTTWSPVAGMGGVHAAKMEKRPEGLLVSGKFVAEIRFDRAQKEGEWHWRTLLAKGAPLSGFEQVRALWMYHPKERRIYARLEDGASPAQAALLITKSSKPLIEIAATGVMVEGLTLRGGAEAVRFAEGAHESVVRGCKVTSYEGAGIVIAGGASRCTVEDCEITRGAFEEWRPTNEKRRENYEIWRIHKDVGKYDRVGIEITRAGAGNRVLRNRLDRVFDGICLGDYRAESLDKPLPDPESGRGAEIAHNIIENTRDSGIELGAGCIEVEVHHNTLRHAHGGLRFKAPRIGPVFIHHNHLVDGAPFHLWFSMDAAPAEGYVYHNTFEGGDDAAVVYSSFNAQRDFATPKWHILNNLVLRVKDGFFDQRKGTPPRDFTESHNLITEDASAAADAGRDLSSYREGKPLPGCEKGSFQGKAPDVGAQELQP